MQESIETAEGPAEQKPFDPEFAVRGRRKPVPARFDRLARLVGAPAIDRLAESHVAIFGLGGVGSYAVEGLARSGVGHLRMVDFDDVCITNFNRQLHALQGTVGTSKSLLMEQRVQSINPRCRIEAPQMFYDAETSESLLEAPLDFVIDAVDNVTAKLHLLATCVRREIPVISCLGAAAKLDPSRIRVVPLTETHTDPLSQAVRRNLRRKYQMTDEEMSRITAVFSDEPPRDPDPNYTSECGFECICPNGQNGVHSCEARRLIYGSSVLVTSVFGMLAAANIVQQIVRDSAE